MSILKDCSAIKSSKKRDLELTQKAKSWTDLNYNLNSMDLASVSRLVHLEVTGANRWPVLRRLLGRRNRLRLEAELSELETASKKGVVDA